MQHEILLNREAKLLSKHTNIIKYQPRNHVKSCQSLKSNVNIDVIVLEMVIVMNAMDIDTNIPPTVLNVGIQY